MSSSGNFSGRYRSYRGVSVPTACPPGSFCPAGSRHSMEYLCPAGTYSNQTGLENSQQCTPCDPGSYCNGEGELNGGKDNPNAAGGRFCKYKMMYKRRIMTKTLAYGYLSESTQRELSNEYQHDRVLKVYKSLFIFVLWQKNTLDIYYPLCWWWLILLIQNGTKMLKND